VKGRVGAARYSARRVGRLADSRAGIARVRFAVVDLETEESWRLGVSPSSLREGVVTVELRRELRGCP
jgi:hypothetical protein